VGTSAVEELPFFDDRYAGEGVRDGDPGGHKSQTHDRVGDAQSGPDHGDHPHHEVRVEGDPHHRHEEGERVPVPVLFGPAIWHRFPAEVVNREDYRPRDLLVEAAFCKRLVRGRRL
jgi:hypothetical protein